MESEREREREEREKELTKAGHIDRRVPMVTERMDTCITWMINV